ncbi:MAG: sulfoxide reductase heme-binding subunit YedZ [Proteobacteria bacterium]|nr:sulfoxide reductase heme-binding subunit YedZ [Pseudomonadota bacterium]
MESSQVLRSRFARPVLFILCLVPISSLVWRIFYGDLGANPIETITRDIGDWTLRLLLITLAISPLRQWFGWTLLLRFRRMLGLYVFFYAFCHFLIWFVADHSFDFSEMLEDIIKRPYITLGFSAFVLLIPLAATSNQAMVRRLGKGWKKLHRLTYLIVLLGVLHFLWLVKADYLEPGIYAVIAGILLLQRVNINKWFESRSSERSSKPA